MGSGSQDPTSSRGSSKLSSESTTRPRASSARRTAASSPLQRSERSAVLARVQVPETPQRVVQAPAAEIEGDGIDRQLAPGEIPFQPPT